MFMTDNVVKSNERDIAADTVRVIAMFFVIFVHVSMAGYPMVLNNVCSALYLTCNGLFFMLSGKFNLRFIGNTAKDYGRYYLKKLITIGFPFVFFSGVITLYTKHTYGLGIVVKSFVKGMFDGTVSGHLWFMFPLIGMLISVPFLSKMIATLNKSERKILIFVALLWEGIRAFLAKDICRTEFCYSGWFLDSWPIYFVLGYVIDSVVETDKGKKRLILAGGICYIFTVIQKTFIPEYSFNIFDRSPIYIITTAGMYELISRLGRKIKGVFCSVIAFLAKHSFSVYFIHFSFISAVEKHYTLNLGAFGNRTVKIMLVIVCSVFCATVIDTILINPVINFLKKKIK